MVTVALRPPRRCGALRRLARRPPSRLMCVVFTMSLLGLLGISLVQALRSPAHLGLYVIPSATGSPQVSWVLPDGPAWSAGIRPGDFCRSCQGRAADGQLSPPLLVTQQLTAAQTVGQDTDAHTVILEESRTSVTHLDLVIALLGFCLVLLGLGVILNGRDEQARVIFWEMCLAAGTALALVPAGQRGLPWALVLQYGALRLTGPALVELAWAFPHAGSSSASGSSPRRHAICAERMPDVALVQEEPRPEALRSSPVRHGYRHALLWLPALALLVLYAFCWRWPVPLFDVVQVVASIVLALYLLGACGYLFWRMLSSQSREQYALEYLQMRLLTIGVVGGFAPFIFLTLLPTLLTGRPILPATGSIVSLVLFPACIGLAITRAEFLGITTLIHRRTLRPYLCLALLCLIGIGAWKSAWLLTEDLRWSPALVATVETLLVAFTFAPLYHWLQGWAEHLFLHDAYDSGGTLLALSVEFSQAPANELGPLLVMRLGDLLDLSLVAFVTPQTHWFYLHPRSRIPSAVQDDVLHCAHILLGAPVAGGQHAPASAGQHDAIGDARAVAGENGSALPVLQVPVVGAERVQAVLCLGPKRSGDRYTEQDRALLATLCRHLSLILANHQLLDQLDHRIDELRQLVTEREILSRRVLSAREEERHHVAEVLHDDALQLGGQLERTLRDLSLLRHLPAAVDASIQDAVQVSQALTRCLRAVVTDLYPAPLEMIGLLPALQSLLQQVERDTGICATVRSAEFVGSGTKPLLTSEQQAILYAITREAVQNAVRHAEASKIEVELTYDAAGLHLSICDDGVGFALRPTRELITAGHLGVALLHERAQALQGTLQVTSESYHGTRITIDVPLPARSDAQATDTPASNAAVIVGDGEVHYVEERRGAPFAL